MTPMTLTRRGRVVVTVLAVTILCLIACLAGAADYQELTR